MRCFLSFACIVDIQGASCPGQFWAITHIPAKNNNDTQNEPCPSLTQAVVAMQPLDVIEIELPADIDTPDNETGEDEMRKHGYTGNTNRRAIPVVVVRYATALPGLGKREVGTSQHAGKGTDVRRRMCSLSSGTLASRPVTLGLHTLLQPSMHCSRTCCKSTIIWIIRDRHPPLQGVQQPSHGPVR